MVCMNAPTYTQGAAATSIEMTVDAAQETTDNKEASNADYSAAVHDGAWCRTLSGLMLMRATYGTSNRH